MKYQPNPNADKQYMTDDDVFLLSPAGGRHPMTPADWAFVVPLSVGNYPHGSHGVGCSACKVIR